MLQESLNLEVKNDSADRWLKIEDTIGGSNRDNKRIVASVFIHFNKRICYANL